MACADCLQQRTDLIALAVALVDSDQRDALAREIIDGRPRHYCEGCGRRIPQYHGMQNSGFESVAIHHYHGEDETLPNGKVVTLHIPIHQELCHECYLEDYAANYPTAPQPVIASARFDCCLPKPISPHGFKPLRSSTELGAGNWKPCACWRPRTISPWPNW